MSRILTVSDTHFQNESIIEYCGRPFENSDDQTRQLIANWNAAVSPDDTVIHCGDFIMGNPKTAAPIIDALNGKIILVRGNHDTPAKLKLYEQFPDKITVKDLHYEQHGGLWFIFCHFPMTNPEFLKMVIQDNSEVCVVHGHLHDKVPFYTPETHSFNVSVDVTDFHPAGLSNMFAIVRDDFMSKGVWRGR